MILAVPLLFGFTGAALFHYWPRRLPLPVERNLERIAISRGHCTIYLLGRTLVGNVNEFDDGLFAYLMFDYYRSRPAFADRQVMLVSDDRGPSTLYRILVRLPDDLIRGIDELAGLKAQRFISTVQYNWITNDELARDLQQTKVFSQSYEGPIPRRLEELHGHELQGYLRRFIRFKSVTDPRIHQNLNPVPTALTPKEASRLAADMIAVSNFYDISLSLLIGIGAMENNFMNVPGDLKNTTWKHHAEPGDIVLKRRGGRVLVKDTSSGVWQITRESLRYAHRLFLWDKRDYSQLPARLRPPKELNVNDVNQDVLTTYAGLLLRDLLDRLNGDVTLAAGAYNGGYTNPNAHYAAGVEMVATYARRIINRAAELNNSAIALTLVNSRTIANNPK